LTTINNKFSEFAFVEFHPQRIVSNEDEVLQFHERNVSMELEKGLEQAHPNINGEIRYFCAIHVQYGSIQLQIPTRNFKKRNRKIVEKKQQQQLVHLNGTKENIEKLLSLHLIYVPTRNFFGADQLLVYCTANNETALVAFENKHKKQLQEEQKFITNFFDWYSFLSIIVKPVNDPPTIHVNKTWFVVQDDEKEKYLHELLNGMIRIADEDDDDTVIGLPFNLPSTYMVNVSVANALVDGRGIIGLPPRKYLAGLTVSEEKGEDATSSDSIALVGPLPRIHVALSHVLFSPEQKRFSTERALTGSIVIQCWDIPRDFRRTSQQLFIPNTTFTDNWATHVQTISFQIKHVNRPPTVTFTCRSNPATQGVLQTHEDIPFVFCQNKSFPCSLELNDPDSNPRQDILSLQLKISGENTNQCVGEFRPLNRNYYFNVSSTSCLHVIQGTLTFLREALKHMQIVFLQHWHGHSRLYVSISDAHGATGKDDILLIVFPWNDPPTLTATAVNITLNQNTPTLLSTSTTIAAYDPDVLVFSSIARKVPSLTATVNSIGCCGTVKLIRKVAGCYIVTKDINGISDSLGPYSSLIFRGSLDAINEAISLLLYLSSCFLEEDSSPSLFPCNGELTFSINDEGFYGGTEELEAQLSVMVHIVENSSVLLPSSSSVQKDVTSLTLHEYEEKRKINIAKDVSVYITADFGHICMANSSQLMFDGLPQEQVIIANINDDNNCMTIRHNGKNSGLLLQGKLTEMNSMLSRLMYAPPIDKWGVDKVKFSSNNNTDNFSDLGLFDVVIKPQNDVPIIHINGTKEGLDRLPSTWETVTVSAQEDTSTPLPLITLSDRDMKPNQFLNSEGRLNDAEKMLTESMLRLELTFIARHGQIRVDSRNDDIVVEFKDSETHLSGSIEGINRVLSRGISYHGDLNFHGADTIDIQSKNQNAAIDERKSAYNTFSRKMAVNVASVNDAPNIILPPSNKGIVFSFEDKPGFICCNGTDGNFLRKSIISCQGVTVHDVESDRISLRVSIDRGRLSFSKPFHASESAMQIITDVNIDIPNKDITLQGTGNEINKILSGMIFSADRNFNSRFGDLAILSISATDQHGASASSCLGIHVEPINDPPVLISSFDIVDSHFRTGDELSFKRVGCNTLHSYEDELTPVLGVKVRDVDAEQSIDLVEVEIFTSNGGLLLVAEDSPIENWIAGYKGSFFQRLHFQSFVQEANEALRTLHYQSAPDFNGVDAIHVRVSDLIDTEAVCCNEGDAMRSCSSAEMPDEHADFLTIPVEVVGVADAPVMLIPDLLEVIEDTPLTYFDKFKVHHIDGYDTIVHIKIQCEHCREIRLSLDGTNNLSEFYSGNDGQYYYVEGTGSVVEWNLCLGDLTYISSRNWNTKDWSLDELSFAIRNTNLNGSKEESREFVTLVDVKAQNDAPVWVVPGQHLKLQSTGGYIISSVDSVHVDEDEELVIESVYIVDNDLTLDRSSTCLMLHVMLKVTSGKIEIATIAGLWIQENHDESIVEWKGKLEFTNAALSRIVYRGDPNFHGDDKLEMFVSDQGCDGDGGVLTSSVVIPIVVNSVNDRPAWTVPWDPVLCSKKDLYCSLNDVSVQDLDGHASVMYIGVRVEQGRLSFSDAELPSSIQFSEGDWQFRDKEFRFYGLLNDANVLLSRMRYHKDLDAVQAMGGTVLIKLVVTDEVNKEDQNSAKIAYVLLQLID